MMEFETLEEFSVASEISDATVKVRLRRQLNHKPTRFSPAPYCLDLAVGSVVYQHYGIDEQRAREAAMRFLLKHVNGVAPPLH
ncbi:conserved hypothetical protein [Paraburkholderia tropica]|uniref:hypothetical protein n=1 Tax=Paraburkholderia tropica TaxID=92647 RepID=UPI001CB3BC9F|nr:hypothetical protein [Paraburkholderia tropica]CAG9223734.1 conserved hypothetical protein [Paraburkholderia tropica]